jgi:anti-sigma B factor antagonist
MSLRVEKKLAEPDITVLALTGQFVSGTECEHVEMLVDDLLRAGTRKILFDLTAVEHMDSSGVGAVVMCSAKLRKCGGELRLCGAWGSVENLLKLTRVSQIIGHYLNQEAATKEFILKEE